LAGKFRQDRSNFGIYGRKLQNLNQPASSFIP